jgi:hypothetical protein
MPTLCALEEASTLESVKAEGSAFGTFEALGPPAMKERAQALVLGSVAFPENGQRKAFLKLDSIDRHGELLDPYSEK